MLRATNHEAHAFKRRTGRSPLDDLHERPVCQIIHHEPSDPASYEKFRHRQKNRPGDNADSSGVISNGSPPGYFWFHPERCAITRLHTVCRFDAGQRKVGDHLEFGTVNAVVNVT
jgi:hypothetical protein